MLIQGHAIILITISLILLSLAQATKTKVDGASSKPVLLVSAYFPVANSKHSESDYIKWMTNFLSNIDSPIYFFTPPCHAETILNVRGDLPIIINTTFTTPFEVPPIKPWKTHYEHQAEIDPENVERILRGRKHGPELYAAWHAKPYFLLEGVKNSRLEGNGDATYEYAFWVDAGSFRSPHDYRSWPSVDRVESIWNKEMLEDRIFVELMALPEKKYATWSAVDGPFEDPKMPMSAGEFLFILFMGIGSLTFLFVGGFFGGPVSSIQWLADTWYKYHDRYLTERSECPQSSTYFMATDQRFLNLLLLLHPEKFIASSKAISTFSSRTKSNGVERQEACGDPWFYYLYFFSSRSERWDMSLQVAGASIVLGVAGWTSSSSKAMHFVGVRRKWTFY